MTQIPLDTWFSDQRLINVDAIQPIKFMILSITRKNRRVLLCNPLHYSRFRRWSGLLPWRIKSPVCPRIKRVNGRSLDRFVHNDFWCCVEFSLRAGSFANLVPRLLLLAKKSPASEWTLSTRLLICTKIGKERGMGRGKGRGVGRGWGGGWGGRGCRFDTSLRESAGFSLQMQGFAVL